MNLPPACPSNGFGSSLKPIYVGTHVAMRCWKCELILPEVIAAIEVVFERETDRFPAHIFEAPRHPERVPYRFFNEILAAACANILGLCPACIADLKRERPCPKPVFVEVSDDP